MSSISAIMCAPKYHHLMNVESEIMRLWKHLPRDAHKSRKTWSIKQSMSRQAIFCTWHTGCFLWQHTQALVSPYVFLSFTVFPLCMQFLNCASPWGLDLRCFAFAEAAEQPRAIIFSLSLLMLPTPFSTSEVHRQKKLFCEFDHGDYSFLGVLPIKQT